MRSRKSDEGVQPVPFPGRGAMLHGGGALLETERLACEALLVSPEHRNEGFPVPVAEPTFADPAGVARPATAPSPPLVITEAADGDMPALLAGLALQGVRASAFAAAAGGLADGLAAAAGRHLPFVVHLCGRALTRQAIAAHGAHDDYHLVADSGAFLMFARNAQEVADYALIARRVAEHALLPGVCAHDRYATGHAVRNLRLAGDDLARAYLGAALDTIACPNDAQRVLFGPSRRRVPVLLDRDRPAGIGVTQDAESHLRAAAACRAFFSVHLPAIVDDAMREFAALTGRAYARVTGYLLDDAEFVVAAQGALVDELIPVVDYLRAERKLRAGVLNVAVLRPFAGNAVSRFLARKRAVTVLERADSALAEDPPLLREIRAAVDRAVENARADGPHPDYAVYRRAEDRPVLLSGVYGVGTTLPAFSQLVAVFENMTHEGAKRRFVLGAGYDVETRRFPHLQTLRQRLDREYPGASGMFLDAVPSSLDPRRNDGSLEIASHSVQGALFAGNLFAQALADATGWSVHTYPDGGLDRSLQPARFALAFQRTRGAACTRPVVADAALVSGESLIETLAAAGTLRRRGTLIAGSVRDAESLWRALSKRAADWVRAQSISFHVLDARRVAAETAAYPSFIDQLSIWALLGAYARIHLALSVDQARRLEEALRARLPAEPGLDAAVVDEVLQTFRRGAAECSAVAWSEWGAFAHPVGEPETPWTLRKAEQHDGTVFDAARFWQSVGYLYDRGQTALALADPHLAAALVPARTSAFRDLTPVRLRIPEWLPSRCSGCGVCWAQCPESALPATVRTLPEAIEAAMLACEKAGSPFVQLKRLADNLAKFAARAAARPAPQPYETLAAVLTDAFARLVDRAGLDGDRLVAARAEFERLVASIDGFPAAVTETFFAKPEAAAAGSGRLLSIALNPMSCNACGLCVAECPEGALVWADQTPDRVAAAWRNWDFLMDLPSLDAGAIASCVSQDDPETNLNRLLDGDVYHSLVGGDGSPPGNGARIAVHLVTAAMESVMSPRYAAHAARLSALIEGLEARIQGKVQDGFRINDFEQFSRRLQQLDRAEITSAALLGVTGDGAGTVDAAHLARLTRLLDDLKAQRRSYRPDAGGVGCSRLVMTIDPGSDGFWSGTYPYNPHPQPWAAQRPGDAVAMAAATAEALARRTAAELSACRRADDELCDVPATATATAWRDLAPEERALAPRVVVLSRPDALSIEGVWRALAVDLPITIVVVDAEGVGADFAAEGGAAGRLDALMLALARDGRNVVQVSIGAPGHLIQAVVDSLGAEGPAILRVYAPDPVTSGIAPDQTVALARLAVASRAVPVFTCFGGRDAVALDGNPDPDRAWSTTELSVTEPSGAEGNVEVALTLAHWAARQARFRRHFRVVSKGHRSDRTKPLPEYLALTAEAREGIQPYIDVRDAKGRHAVALVSREMADLAARAAARWNALRGSARADAAMQPAVPPAPATVLAPAAAGADAYRLVVENLLRLSGHGGDDPFFRRSLRDFVSRARGDNGDAE